MQACTVLITAPDEQSANALAEALVSERLAACVNILPGLTSVYRWQGEVQREGEILLLAKTQKALLDSGEFVRRVKALHPYEVPEVIALPIVAGAADYLAWVEENTGAPPQQPEK
ncbi:MAG: divalent-cation tolerance protein CutA [Anaerolineae bacterium]|nr:MAG: divalent-cation tolerance protein CutA [Anaerolineae bacterium]